MNVLGTKGTRLRHRILLSAVVASSLLALAPASAAPVIQRGIDVFKTLGDGRTFYDFSRNPIPSGFFCDGSKAFAERVAFKGLPLATGTPGQLWGADTIVERLDNTTLNGQGVGTTRLQFRALSLVSVAPIKTSCGAFHVYVSLAGKQRVTTMAIVRTEQGGGTFTAPLAVDVRMSFIPVKAAQIKNPTRQRPLELTAAFTFPPNPLPWSFNNNPKKIGAATVDTNGDQKPDFMLPGTSNFQAGRSPGRVTANMGLGDCPQCAEVVCHAVNAEEEHCYTAPTPWNCPEVMECVR